MNIENIVGQPLKQLICNRANSTGRGAAHLQSTQKKWLNRWRVSLSSIWLCQWGQIDMDMHYKQLIEFQYLQYKSNYTRRTWTLKICGSAPQPTRQQQGQLIWEWVNSFGKYKKYININIVGWVFSQFVWNRNSSSGEAPFHLEKSKREDYLNSGEGINFIITTREHCVSAPQPARLQQGQLIWKGANTSEKKIIIKICNQYCGLALPPTRLEQAELIVWKGASSSGK